MVADMVRKEQQLLKRLKKQMIDIKGPEHNAYYDLLDFINAYITDLEKLWSKK